VEGKTKMPLEYGRSLKKLLGCGANTWYTWFVGWIEYSINTSKPFLDSSLKFNCRDKPKDAGLAHNHGESYGWCNSNLCNQFN
jgi:hypothetical protein